MKHIFLIIIISLITLQGCKTQRVFVNEKLPNPTYREFLEFHEQWQKSIRTFKGRGRITLDTPQFSGNFEADIYSKGNDSLLVSVSGFMGTQVGKVFVGKNRFIFYNQYDNQFITGRKEDFGQTAFLQFPISISRLREVFLAQDHFNILKKEKFEKKENTYYLSAQNGKFRYNIWFDESNWMITKIEYIEDDQLLFFKEYKKFVNKDGIYFPLLINFVRPSEKQGMSVIFKEIQINKPVSADVFKVKVSDNAQQVLIPSNQL